MCTPKEDEVLQKAFRNASALLELKQETIEEIGKNGQSLLLIRIFLAIFMITGGDEKTMKHWLKTDNLHLQSVPEVLLSDKEGLEKVLQYLETMARI